MRTFLDCIPCLMRQALDAARVVSSDTAVHEKILREVLGWASEMDMSKSAPVLAQMIHRRLNQITGVEDPYRAAKDAQNRMAMDMMPKLKALVENSADPLALSVRLAIAGNIIDLGVKGSVDKPDLHESVERALNVGLEGDIEDFKAVVESAESILYLADNAGEIVFDRLLIEQLPLEKVTLVVRGHPIINDVTMVDARSTGLTDLVTVIDNGSDAPGTVLDDCSRMFRDKFESADLIVSKGQGNFETLSDTSANIYFLFQVKCSLVAEQAQRVTGSHILMRSKGWKK